MSGDSRITVTLIPKVRMDLANLKVLTGITNQSDLVNRALTFYAFYERERSTGKQVLLRDPDSGETHQIQVL